MRPHTDLFTTMPALLRLSLKLPPCGREQLTARALFEEIAQNGRGSKRAAQRLSDFSLLFGGTHPRPLRSSALAFQPIQLIEKASPIFFVFLRIERPT